MSVERLSSWLHSWWSWVVSLQKNEAAAIIRTYNRIVAGVQEKVDQVEFACLGPGITCEVLFFDALRSGYSIRSAVNRYLSQMAPELPSETRLEIERGIAQLVIDRVASVLAELEERLRNEIAESEKSQEAHLSLAR